MIITRELRQGGFGAFTIAVIVNADAGATLRACDRGRTPNPA
jgi:hypothetical protein